MNNIIYQMPELEITLRECADLAIRETIAGIGNVRMQEYAAMKGCCSLGQTIRLQPDSFATKITRWQLDLFCSAFKTWELKVDQNVNNPEMVISFERNVIKQEV